MFRMVANRDVTCDVHSEDQYGRLIATCFVDGIDIGREQVITGLAWAFRRYSTVYADEEDRARSARRGIWQSKNQPAWAFRQERWQEAINTSPRPGCPIKGNISQHGHIYHTPWSPWYNRTIISEHKGERWFCDELEAVQAGWRAPYWP